MTRYLLVFLLASSVSWLLTPAVSRLSSRFGVIDRPNARKVHLKPTPKAGGLAIGAGLLIAVTADSLWDGRLGSTWLLSFLSLCTLVMVIGWVDDKWEISASQKLLAVLVPAVLWSIGQHPLTVTGVVRAVVDVGFILAAVNAVNLLDGLDGLVAGVGAVSASCLALVGLLLGKSEVAIGSLALAGATAGFLPHNFEPASIFMGDTGSLLVGFCLGVLGLQATSGGVISIDLPVALGCLALPFFDTLITVVRRRIHHRPIFAPDKSHTYNILVASGMSTRATVITCYILASLFGGLSITYVLVSGLWSRFMAVTLAVILMIIAVLHFNFLQVDSSNGPSRSPNGRVTR